MPKFRTVLLDCDSTLSAIEGIDELAVHCREDVERLTDAAMRGRIPLEEVYGRRLELVRPTRAAIEALGRQYVARLVPDARETIAALQAAGVDVRIISGGSAAGRARSGRRRGSRRAITSPPSTFRSMTDGSYAGFDGVVPLAATGGKRSAIERWHVDRPAMMVGDGNTDLEARPVVDMFVAFAGVVERPSVVQRRRRRRSREFARAPPSSRAARGRACSNTALQRLRPRRRAERDRHYLLTRRVTSHLMTAHSSAGVAASPASRPLRAASAASSFPARPKSVPSVLAAMEQPMIGHRGKGMEELIARIEPDLQYVFRTTRPVYIASSSATGLMEGAIRNGVRSRVLSLVNGAFSERFFQIARACGVEAEALTVPLGPGAHAAKCSPTR